MSKLLRYCSILAIVGLLLAQSFASPKATAKPEEGVTGNLVTTKWLADHLKSPDILLLDASSPPLYAANHIPGAIGANRPEPVRALGVEWRVTGDS